MQDRGSQRRLSKEFALLEFANTRCVFDVFGIRRNVGIDTSNVK